MNSLVLSKASSILFFQFVLSLYPIIPCIPQWVTFWSCRFHTCPLIHPTLKWSLYSDFQQSQGSRSVFLVRMPFYHILIKFPSLSFEWALTFPYQFRLLHCMYLIHILGLSSKFFFQWCRIFLLFHSWRGLLRRILTHI